jgi:hypothetical protein
MTIIGHRINGEVTFEENSRLGDVFNPATGEVERQVALASKCFRKLEHNSSNSKSESDV